MNLKVTGVLVLVAIIVGGVAYFNPFAGDDDDGPRSPWFYQVSEEDIATIAVTHLGDSVSFYKTEVGTWAFQDPEGIPPNFRWWGGITLLLSGPRSSARREMPDGTKPVPGGWNRIMFEVEDIESEVTRLKEGGVKFRNPIISGPGGQQSIAEDLDGNAIEVFQPD